MSRITVVVHPGFLQSSQFDEHRNETRYGNYQLYLKNLEKFVKKNESIMLTNPEAYRSGCRAHDLIPFKVPKKTEVITDYELPIDDWEVATATRNYVGSYRLLKILEKKASKEEEMRLCGERLWWINSDNVVPGCVIYYFNLLNEEGYKPKIERQLCYPTKNPPDEKNHALLKILQQS
jgi:hypothetical protein